MGKGARKITRWERRFRSLIKRTVLKPINASGTYIVQAVPEFAHNRAVEFRRLRALWRQDVGVNNDADMIRMFLLITNVEALETSRVPGAFAELGVWRGNSARLLRELAPGRTLYLFDTFAGFHKADTETDPRGVAAGIFGNTSLERVKQFVGTAPNIRYCVGRFPETVGAVPPGERFALVHVDLDLYAPTRAACEFFYPRLSPGGILVFHDYDSEGWPGVTKAVDEFLADKPEGVVRIPDRSGSAVLVRVKR